MELKKKTIRTHTVKQNWPTYISFPVAGDRVVQLWEVVTGRAVPRLHVEAGAQAQDEAFKEKTSLQYKRLVY